MAFQRNIVVTGAGVVSPIGIGVESFWAAIDQQRSGIRRLDLPVDPDMPIPIGGVAADFDPKQYVRPRKSLKVMSRDIQLAFAAADLACVEAGVPDKPIDPERFGVVFGANIIPCEIDELAGTYRSCLVDGQFSFDRWGHAAMVDLFPLWMLKYLPNMSACHVGIAQDARGPNNTITLGDVSTLAAIAEAARIVDRGQADAIIGGGVGSRVHPAIWVRNHMFGLSRHGDVPERALRPFDATRDGLAGGEGAGTLLLEPEAKAQARGANVLARMLGHGIVFRGGRNGQAMRREAIALAISTAVRDAGLKPADVGFVVANGVCTVDDDRAEAQAIRETLGDVPVTAAKGYFGHLGAGTGSLEAVLAVLALRHGRVPPALNFETPDGECPINVIHGEPMPLDRRVSVVLSHSVHGQAAAVVLAGA